jgi:hypothetical protein
MSVGEALGVEDGMGVTVLVGKGLGIKRVGVAEGVAAWAVSIWVVNQGGVGVLRTTSRSTSCTSAKPEQ